MVWEGGGERECARTGEREKERERERARTRMGERERERVSVRARGRESPRESALAPPFTCFFFHLGLPYANWA